jgi:hypothetical protein
LARALAGLRFDFGAPIPIRMSRDSTPRAERPDWHMRWPFAVAYLAIVVAGFLVDWRAGVFLLAWVPLKYLWHVFVRWQRSWLEG